jgi:hypothetical protein
LKIKKLAGSVAAATAMFSIGAVAPASAADPQVFGLQQTVNDPNGGEIAYTVTKFLPSEDAIPFPVSGQLYEATVRADALNGLVTPAIPAFSAQTESGQNYPALAGVWTPQGLSGAALLPGGHSSGKVYFDAVGDAPTSIVYNGAGDMLTWMEPPTASEEEAAAPEEEAAPEEGASSGEEAAPESESPDSASVDSEGNGDVATAEEEG